VVLFCGIAIAVGVHAADAGAYLGIPTARHAISLRLHKVWSGSSIRVAPCFRSSTTRVVCGYRVTNSAGSCTGRMVAWVQGPYLYTQGIGGSCAAAPASPQPPSGPTTYTGGSGGHWIIDESLDGSVITLEDGSKWLVSPLDRYQDVTWLVTDNIVITMSYDPYYPYELTDTDDGSSVNARFLGY
jgi:hypothetical protein